MEHPTEENAFIFPPEGMTRGDLIPSEPPGKTHVSFRNLGYKWRDGYVLYARFIQCDQPLCENTVGYPSLGAEMEGGKIVVGGYDQQRMDTGSYVGGGMSGGQIIIYGDVSDFLGHQMTGGSIEVFWYAGMAVGHEMGKDKYETPEIVVHKRASNYVGYKMEGGTIKIMCEGVDPGVKCTGVGLGRNMKGGTIYIFGKAGSLATGEEAPSGDDILIFENCELEEETGDAKNCDQLYPPE